MYLRCFLVSGALALAACGAGPDDRPETFEYVTFAILAPKCGTVACHSTTTRTRGFAFDTLAASRDSLNAGLVDTDTHQLDRSTLYDIITTTGSKRMPADAPLATRDIDLIGRWIEAGAEGL